MANDIAVVCFYDAFRQGVTAVRSMERQTEPTLSIQHYFALHKQEERANAAGTVVISVEPAAAAHPLAVRPVSDLMATIHL